jgi:hypothetical protein
MASFEYKSALQIQRLEEVQDIYKRTVSILGFQFVITLDD